MSAERLSPDEFLGKYANPNLDYLSAHQLKASIEAAERDNSSLVKLPPSGLMDLVARLMGAKIVPITETLTDQLPEQQSN